MHVDEITKTFMRWLNDLIEKENIKRTINQEIVSAISLKR